MLRLMWRMMETESIEGYPRDLTTTPSLDPTTSEKTENNEITAGSVRAGVFNRR